MTFTYHHGIYVTLKIMIDALVPKNSDEMVIKLSDTETLFNTIDIRNIPDYKDFLSRFTRLVNNFISAEGLLNSAEIYYPNFNYTKSGKLFIEQKNKLTGIDGKVMDPEKVRTKIEGLLTKIDNPHTKQIMQDTFSQLKAHIEYLFRKQREKEVNT